MFCNVTEEQRTEAVRLKKKRVGREITKRWEVEEGGAALMVCFVKIWRCDRVWGGEIYFPATEEQDSNRQNQWSTSGSASGEKTWRCNPKNHRRGK